MIRRRSSERQQHPFEANDRVPERKERIEVVRVEEAGNGSCRTQSDMTMVSTCANTTDFPMERELDERQRPRGSSEDAYRGTGTGFCVSGHGGGGGRGAREGQWVAR